MTAHDRRGGTRRLRVITVCTVTSLLVGTATGPALSAPAQQAVQPELGGATSRSMEPLDRGAVAVRSGDRHGARGLGESEQAR